VIDISYPVMDRKDVNASYEGDISKRVSIIVGDSFSSTFGIFAVRETDGGDEVIELSAPDGFHLVMACDYDQLNRIAIKLGRVKLPANGRVEGRPTE